MTIVLWVGATLAILAGIAVLILACVLLLLNAMYDSIQPLPPTSVPEEEETSSALFRHLPFLKSRLAYTPLGVFPTPIHRAHIPNLTGPGQHGAIFIKREDLSSPIYGGNKVRTLQHQLAACVEHLKTHPDATFISVGSGGSNQNVAAVVHGRRLGVAVHPFLLKPDVPDIDNTLNVLSLLSFNPPVLRFWTTPLANLTSLVRALVFGPTKVFTMGGNNMLGVLGQIGGLLELAEQIHAGEMPDVDVLYLPIGSACTITGLILGVVLARHLNLHAFRSLRIVGVPVHPIIAHMEKRLGLFTSSWGLLSPLSPRYGIRRAAVYLQQQGLDIDLEPLAVAFLHHNVDICLDTDLIGQYGTHSVTSLAAASFDSVLQVDGPAPKWATDTVHKTPWLCGHFAAKPFAKMLQDIEAETHSTKAKTPLVRLFWQTKSWIQPRGPADEWQRLVDVAATAPSVREWANQGRASSLLRRGSVRLPHGSPETYQSLMTAVDLETVSHQ
ncbi:Aste57867_12693 [Aphanomyces stellatus]|uniref:Aste57867_12693 protein n=1 Tax=Aphanomyces stellatus TaxID=120398 RepID=A0A485KWL5_9STRA|nr:hypothetical protein As57867_012646 [Aphanomyces stellatus]VFT89543.1 Aste57867_12693 [Aphanomyces stellatus]